MIQPTFHPSWTRNRISCADCAVFIDPVYPRMIFKWESKTLRFSLDMSGGCPKWRSTRQDASSPPDFSTAMQLLLKIVNPWIEVRLKFKEVSYREWLAGRRVSDAPTADELSFFNRIAAEVFDELLNSDLVIL